MVGFVAEGRTCSVAKGIWAHGLLGPLESEKRVSDVAGAENAGSQDEGEDWEIRTRVRIWRKRQGGGSESG